MKINKKCNLFVSYAYEDKDWVIDFTNDLKNVLEFELGGKDKCSFWNSETSQDESTPDVSEHLKNANFLLLISSSYYFTSSRCRKELSMFLVKNTPEQVVIIERGFVQRPDELQYSPGYNFKVNPESAEYFQRLNDLALELSSKINPISETLIGKTLSNKTIFLAEVSDDLEEHRNEVKRFLEQKWAKILPNKRYSFANTQQLLDQDLTQCDLFVQLLSGKIDRYSSIQHERAKTRELPILQWCNPISKLSTYDDEYQLLLSQDNVIATNLVSFQELIFDQLTETHIDVAGSTVFINADKKDMPLAHQIKDFLEKQHHLECGLPLETSASNPSEIQQHLAQHLENCKAVIMVYDKTSVNWIDNQLLYCQRVKGQHEQPFKVIVVYNVPSKGKSSPSIYLPNQQNLDCPTQQAKTCLPKFIEALQE